MVVVMNSKLKLICFATLVLLFFNAVSFADLLFKMTSEEGNLGHPITGLVIGEKVNVHVWAWVNDAIAEPDNGLDTWQMDMDVDNTGVIQITKTGGVANIDLIAPDPDPLWSGWDEASVNNEGSPYFGATGEVREVVVTQDVVSAPSYTGVGGYSEIFSFQIEAIGVGTATYTLKKNFPGGLFLGMLADGTEFDYDIDPGSVYFDATVSEHVFTVVPEPASLLIMAFITGLALRNRRIDSGR
jgi:hypothetical protein